MRALAKIMDFLRAVSIILVVMNVYWFCYEAIRLWGVNIGVVDKILMNFDRTAGLFRSILYTKLFAVLLLALSCFCLLYTSGWIVLCRAVGTLLLYFGFSGCPFVSTDVGVSVADGDAPCVSSPRGLMSFFHVHFFYCCHT